MRMDVGALRAHKPCHAPQAAEQHFASRVPSMFKTLPIPLNLQTWRPHRLATSKLRNGIA